MAAIIFTLLFAIQACIGKSVNNECCESKTVGAFAYTLVHTTVDFPDECLNSCAYTRDDQPGSLYCFAKGEQPVTCTEYCFPGPPGSTGCPPVDDLKITNYPSTQGYRPSSNDCYDFCRALCPPAIGPPHIGPPPPCQCSAWTYNTEDQICSTFDGFPPCYDTIQEDGWISGAPCYDSNTDPIKEVENIPGDFEQQPLQYGPFGNIEVFRRNFTDEPNGNPITEIKVWTDGDGTADPGYNVAIIGIQFTYEAADGETYGQPHGSTTGPPTQHCTIQPGTFFTNITVRSFESAPDPENNSVFYLEFASTDQNMNPKICKAGTSNLGTETKIPMTDKNTVLSHILGNVTLENPTLASLSFVYNVVP